LSSSHDLSGELRSTDAFEGVEHRARSNSLERIRPPRPLAQVHRIVVPVGEPQSNRYPPGRLEAQGINQLLAQEPHGGRAENDDALLVQSDDPLIGPKVEQFCEVQVLTLWRVVAT
jgi:hypothetical protein